MKKTLEFYQEAVKRAASAADVIGKANAAYKREEKIYKGMLEDDLIGQTGFDEKIKKLEQEKEKKIDASLYQILKIADEYTAEMTELGKLDGNMIDDGTMKILNSGLTLSSADWQQLANKHKDNFIMTRILKQRYEENKPQEKGTNITIVKFGQTPSERQEIFNKFTKTLCNTCRSNVLPSLASGKNFKTPNDYYNYLAQKSLEDMQPFDDEDFSNLNTEFPVKAENGELINQANSQTTEFNFNFTPVRKVF